MTSALNLDTVDAGEDFTKLFVNAPRDEAQSEPSIALGGSDLSAILSGEADAKEVAAEAAKPVEEGTTSIEHLLDQDSALVEGAKEEQAAVEEQIKEEVAEEKPAEEVAEEKPAEEKADEESAAQKAVRLAEEEAERIETQRKAAEEAAAAEAARVAAKQEKERLEAEQKAQAAAQKKAE